MKTVPLDNDWEFEWYIARKNASTRVIEPVAGLVGLKGRFSATDGGAAIAPAVETVLTERAGAPGYYYGPVTGANIRANMAGLSRAFEVLLDASGSVVVYSEAVQVAPVRHK